MKTILTVLLCMIPFINIAKAEDSWRGFDKDENNELSLDEFVSLRLAQYAAIDRNNDGKWTRREFVKREPNMSEGRIDSLRGKFKKWDKNKDGFWDINEASKAIYGNFRWLDKNKNKSISINEHPKHW